MYLRIIQSNFLILLIYLEISNVFYILKKPGLEEEFSNIVKEL